MGNSITLQFSLVISCMALLHISKYLSARSMMVVVALGHGELTSICFSNFAGN